MIKSLVLEFDGSGDSKVIYYGDDKQEALDLLEGAISLPEGAYRESFTNVVCNRRRFGTKTSAPPVTPVSAPEVEDVPLNADDETNGGTEEEDVAEESIL